MGFSSDPSATNGFGPFTPGFVSVPFGDAEALKTALDIPTSSRSSSSRSRARRASASRPQGYLREARRLCTERNVLLLADQIQIRARAGPGTTFACDHEGVKPDMYLLGKALGGGILPVSAVVSRAEVLGVIRPGEHGSTF